MKIADRYEVLSKRKLTENEGRLSVSVFGSVLDPRKLHFYEVKKPEVIEVEDRFTMATVSKGHGIPEDDGIIVYPEHYRADYACVNDADFSLKCTFVHELAHVWQHQKKVPCSVPTLDVLEVTKDKWYKSPFPIWDSEEKLDSIQTQYSAKNLTKKQRDSLEVLCTVVQEELNQNILTKKNLEKKVDSLNAVLKGRTARDVVDPLAKQWHGPETMVEGGKRLSHVIWEEIKDKGAFSSREQMVGFWMNLRYDKYNYLRNIDPKPGVSGPITIDFYNLNHEQQALMIEEYFILSIGASLTSNLHFTGTQRPPLSLYEAVIPFLPKKLATDRWSTKMKVAEAMRRYKQR